MRGPHLNFGYGQVLVVVRAPDGTGYLIDGGSRAEVVLNVRHNYYDLEFGLCAEERATFAGFDIEAHTGADARCRVVRDFDDWVARTRAESTEQAGLPAGLLGLPRGSG